LILGIVDQDFIVHLPLVVDQNLIRPALRACTLLDCPRVVIAWSSSTFVDDRRLLVARAGVATLQSTGSSGVFSTVAGAANVTDDQAQYGYGY
jgi:hypothetical protein